jgi:predicted TIM-barrel fold metal-dependent hydrolase
MKLTRRKLIFGAAAVAVGAGGYKLLRGFEDDSTESVTQALPPELRRTALDVHVHVLGVGSGNSGCWMHDEMRSSIQVRAGLWSYRLSLDQPDLDAALVTYLRTRMERAGFLKQAVILAQDYVLTAQGEIDRARTPFYTPNDYIAILCRRHPEFLFGASIHPYRPEALEFLSRVAEDGAVLVKWIPNVHAIDLTDPRCRSFYRRMAELKMALLVHVGDEQAMFIAGQEYGDPRRLTAALEEGVTVIAAHVASLGEREGKPNFDWLVEMLPPWPNLYADTSALALLTRWRTLLRVAERADLHGRLVHGSDFPLPPASTYFLGRIPLSKWWHAWTRENPLQRDFLLKRALGLPAEIFTRGYDILAPRLAMIGKAPIGKS